MALLDRTTFLILYWKQTYSYAATECSGNNSILVFYIVQNPFLSATASHLLQQDWGKDQSKNQSVSLHSERWQHWSSWQNCESWHVSTLPATDIRQGNLQSDCQPQGGMNSLVAYGSM